MWGERRRREDECGSGEPVPISGQHFRLLAKTGVDCRRIFCSSLAQEIVMTSFGIRDWISRAGSAVVPAMAVLLSTDAAFSSQSPRGRMGTASPLTQLAIAIILHGASAIAVRTGRLGGPPCR